MTGHHHAIYDVRLASNGLYYVDGNYRHHQGGLTNE